MMAAESLKGVVKDGSVAALFESGKEFGKSSGREIADTREIGNGGESKRAPFSSMSGSPWKQFEKNMRMSHWAQRNVSPLRLN